MEINIIDNESYRLSICNECISNENGTCKECNCIILKKIKREFSHCPKEKW